MPLDISYLDDVKIGDPSESVIDSYPKTIADLSSIVQDVNTSMTEVISYCTDSRKSIVHSLKNAKMVTVDVWGRRSSYA